MNAIIGRYRVRIEEDTGELLLTHQAGISFDLTAEETLGLLDFITAYRETLHLLTGETDAQLKSLTAKKDEVQDDQL